MKSLTLASLIFVSACAETATYVPTENVTTTAQGGLPAAGYDIRPERGAPADVHVKVWSPGPYSKDKVTYVPLTLDIQNTSRDTVQLARNALSLETFTSKGVQLPQPQLVALGSETGSIAVPAGAAVTMRLVFQIPVEIRPSAIWGVRLRWGLERSGGARYVQFTSFQKIPDYYYGYSGPYAGWSGYGYGYGYGYDPYWAWPGYGYGYYFQRSPVVVGSRGPTGQFQEPKRPE